MPLHLCTNITQEWAVAGICDEPFSSGEKRLLTLICRNEKKTLVNRDFSLRKAVLQQEDGISVSKNPAGHC